MIKVCHMTSNHINLDARIFHKQCTSLAKAGYDVYLVARGESFELNGVKVVGVLTIDENMNTTNRKLIYKIIRSVKTIYKRHLYEKLIYKEAVKLNADIYQIHDPALLPYALKLKKKGKKVIYDCHEDYYMEKLYAVQKNIITIIYLFLDVFNFYLPKPDYKNPEAYRKYETKVCKEFDALITVTPHIYDNLKKINNNTFMITNYPIIKDYNETKIYTVSKNIVFTGGINRAYCHHKVIKALGKCNNARYMLYGPSDDNYMNELRNMPEWKYVDFGGRIPFNEVSKKLQEASAGIAILEIYGGVGYEIGTIGNTKLFEYMTEALPVVCTDFILWKEMIEKYNCGVCVDPDDIDEIANAINYLLDNPEIAEEMGQNGRRAVLEEFNWETQEKKLLELYKNL